MSNEQDACFITFEGGDGAGKTTLIDKVYAYLCQIGRSVLKTRAPGGTELGEEIRQLLLSKELGTISPRCELLLFLADRAQHVDLVIRPALQRKEMILCDRFNDSTIAYQGYARGFHPHLIMEFLAFSCQEIKPHLTFYLDLDPEIGFQRTQHDRAKDRIESENLNFHRKIREAFREMAKKEPNRFILLDATLSPETVFQLAQEKIDALLGTPRK